MHVNDEEEQIIREFLDGKYDNDPIFCELREFMMEEFNAELRGFLTGIKTGPTSHNTLLFIVSSEAERMFIKSLGIRTYNSEASQTIKRKFSEIAIKYGMDEGFMDPLNYSLTISEFDSNLKSEIFDECYMEVRVYFRSVPEVKEHNSLMGEYYILYDRDEDIAINEKNGLSAEIKNNLLSIFRKHDKYNIFKDLVVHYSSKQTFRDVYQSNWYYFLK